MQNKTHFKIIGLVQNVMYNNGVKKELAPSWRYWGWLSIELPSSVLEKQDSRFHKTD
jgi:hypothetical protein